MYTVDIRNKERINSETRKYIRLVNIRSLSTRMCTELTRNKLEINAQT